MFIFMTRKTFLSKEKPRERFFIKLQDFIFLIFSINAFIFDKHEIIKL